MTKPAIYMTGLTREAHYIENTGDVDYIATVRRGLKGLGVKTQLLGEGENEDQLLARIAEAPTNGKPPIVHFFLNYQMGTGLGHSVEKLRAFKEQTGAQIILTNIEFKLYDRFKNEKYDEQSFQFFPLADKFTFLDEADRQAALTRYQQLHGDDAETIRKLETAAIIPVPGTVEITDSTHNATGRDIAFMGVIRPNKGFEHVLELAERLKQEGRPEQIILVGTANRTTDNAARIEDTELAKLLAAMYPSKQEEIRTCTDYDALVKRAEAWLQTPPAIPIQLNLNQPPEAYPEIFRECGLAFIPDLHGASLRNTAKSSFTASGIPVVTHRSTITPAELLPGGEYDGAMVLLDKGADTSLAQQMIEVLKQRDANPEHVMQTLTQCGRLAREQLSPPAIAAQMAEVYAVPVRKSVLSI